LLKRSDVSKVMEGDAWMGSSSSSSSKSSSSRISHRLKQHREFEVAQQSKREGYGGKRVIMVRRSTPGNEAIREKRGMEERKERGGWRKERKEGRGVRLAVISDGKKRKADQLLHVYYSQKVLLP
jgi:hypothetical protein